MTETRPKQSQLSSSQQLTSQFDSFRLTWTPAQLSSPSSSSVPGGRTPVTPGTQTSRRWQKRSVRVMFIEQIFEADENGISLTLDENARLYGLQSSVNRWAQRRDQDGDISIMYFYRVLLHLANDNDAEMTFTLSFQEKFPNENFDAKKPHVELVESIDPSEVVNDFAICPCPQWNTVTL